MLHGGAWDDGRGPKQIVSRDRVRTITRYEPEARRYYGYLWWTNRTGQALGPAVRRRCSIFLVVAAVIAGKTASASGHGPVFALATPTNARHGQSLDLGLMGRAGPGSSGAMLRGMFGYGITEDLQVSFSMPVVFSSAAFVPARMTGMMPGSGDVEGIVAWRFHRRGTDVGSRFESTAYGGVIAPGPQRPAGMLGDLARAPGYFVDRNRFVALISRHRLSAASRELSQDALRASRCIA